MKNEVKSKLSSVFWNHATKHVFNNGHIVSILDHQFTVLRGWASVDVEVQGKSFRFITTHLEPTSSVIQVAQANELLQGPDNTVFPVILVCDCNSNANGTGTDTYGNLIAVGFVDAWSQIHPSNPGLTCCQDGDLLNSDSYLSERIDLVLFRGNLTAIESDIVGENTTDRILPPSGLLLWPSDHAGIVAKLSFSPGPTITGFPQETHVSDIAGATRSFSTTANQTVDVTWYINGTEVFNRTGTNKSSYTNTSAAVGTWIVNATATNANGITSLEWTWIVAENLNGDLNGNGQLADAGDLVLMKRASIGEIQADSRYDLNNNGLLADAGDLVLMKRISIGEYFQ